MSRSELHDWECAIEHICGDKASEMFEIAQDIYNTAYVRGKNAKEWEMLEKEQKADWVPVSKKLPVICEKDVRGNVTFSKMVLSCRRYGSGFVYVGNDQYTINNNGAWLSEVPFDDPNECCKVIAWMPLPEPYEESEV